MSGNWVKAPGPVTSAFTSPLIIHFLIVHLSQTLMAYYLFLTLDKKKHAGNLDLTPLSEFLHVLNAKIIQIQIYI